MKKFLIPLLVIALCVIVLIVSPRFSAALTPGSHQTTPPESALHPQVTVPTESEYAGELLQFPLSLEQDGLIIETPFTYDGLNPDNEGIEGQNIAAITVKNNSGRHLRQADITLVLTDGTEVAFRVEHIPSARRVTAFALDNSPLSADAQFSEVRVDAVFAETAGLLGNGVEISENGMLLEVTNSTDTELTNLKIYCHNLLGEEYFGGKSYPYEINNLPAGETVTVEALDCILGIAEAAYTEGN